MMPATRVWFGGIDDEVVRVEIVVERLLGQAL